MYIHKGYFVVEKIVLNFDIKLFLSIKQLIFQDTPFDYNNVDFSDMFKPEKPDDSKVFNPHGNRYIKKKEKRVNRSGHKVNKR